MADLMDDQSLIGDGKMVIEMISDQVPKSIGDQFDRPSFDDECMEKPDLRVIPIIHRNVGRTCFFHLPKSSLLSSVFPYIYISQGSVKMQLWCGERYNKYIIANCPKVC